jgi:co-chaperonin GroES (HSP10)
MHWRPKPKNKILAAGDKVTNQRGTKKDVLKIELNHGDIMIMQGYEIQKLYEVSEHYFLLCKSEKC